MSDFAADRDVQQALLHVRICKFYCHLWNLLQGEQTVNKRNLHRLFNNSTPNIT